ncbi:MAG: protein kinase [Clostridiales bacterium]|nr:protein kinase [Clostridiales bacterium]
MAQAYCYYCMTPTLAGGVCTVCGRAPGQAQREEDVLPPDTRLAGGRVILGERLGRGGFGITYVGMDTKTGQRVAVKEFMPRYLARREGRALRVDPDKRETYDRVLRSFHKEANTIHLLDSHPGIVRVLALFDENGTAYYTMEMLKGLDLHKYLKAINRPLTPAEAYALLEPAMRALSFVHAKGVLHRDISPDNILLCMEPARAAQTRPAEIRVVKLIDFGAAHVAVESFTQSFPEVRKNGYSPLEQNWDGDKQGPWTDVYAFAATVYMALTGKNPVPARDRAQEQDPLRKPSELSQGVSPAVDAVVLKGMALAPKQRYQEIDTFRRELYAAVYNRALPASEPTPQPTPETSRKPSRGGANPAPAPSPSPAPAAGREIAARRVLALLLDAFLFCVLPQIALDTPGLIAGWLLMVILNTGLVFAKPNAALGERLLGLRVLSERGGGPGLPQSLLRAALRGVLPYALWEDFQLAVTGRRPGYDRLTKTTVAQAGLADGAAEESAAVSESGRASVASETGERLASAVGGAPRLTLSAVAGSLQGRTVDYRAPLLLGRDARRANVLVPPEDRLVSGLHASIRLTGGQYRLKDEHSSNGTRLNGTRLDPEAEPVTLRQGDTLELGAERFIITIR